jgi:hypothetical protein
MPDHFRSSALLIITLAAGAMLPSVARATDVVSQWNDLFLDAIRQNGGGPLGAARSGAIIHGAIYDAVNSIAGTHTSLIAKAPVTAPASESAAVAAAGRATMSALYGHLPGMQARIDGLYTSQLNSLPSGTRRTAGVQVGQWVASTILANRANDGFSNAAPYTPGTNVGDWQGNYNPGGNAVGPNWGNVRPFAMTTGSQFRPDGPPALNSAAYAAAYNEVKSLGAANSTTRTEHQTKAAWFWGNDRDGTYKPPGHLNVMSRAVAETQFAGLSEDQKVREMARLMAMTNVALNDAVIASWDAKYNTDLDLWRPIEGVRNGDADGNAATQGDANWTPLSYAGNGGGPYTPMFPAYTSGHSTMAGAHAAILQAFFGTDDIAFSLSTDDQDAVYPDGSPVVFHFQSISEAAMENALSRIWLGVHWRFDTEDGLATGDQVGDLVAAQLFRVIPAPGAAALVGLGGLIAARRRRSA